MPALGPAVLTGLVCLAMAATTAEAQAPPRTRVVRSWEEVVKVGSRTVARRVEIVFDYRAGVARRLTYVGERLVSTQTLRGQPPASREELIDATAILREDPNLALELDALEGEPYAGFVLSEPTGACRRRTRCVQFRIPTSAYTTRCAVVDLVRRATVYRECSALGKVVK